MPWERILRAVEDLVGVPEPERGRWSEVLDSLRTCGLFREVDVRLGARAGVVVLVPDDSVDPESCAAAVKRLGPPCGMNVVSPPIRTPGRPDRRPSWDRKHGVCHVVGDRRVWFGIETTDEVQRLVSISIHYDGSPR